MPPEAKKKLDIYETALEINTARMGFKLSMLTDKWLLSVVTERDIEGMDYVEFTALIADVGFWADTLQEYFKNQFDPV